jgi:hypothetical protein
MKSLRNALAMLVLALPAMQAMPHHSFAMFDQSQRVTLKGKVTDFQWTNPHAFIHLEVTGADGGLWEVELNSPNNLKRQGWKATSLKAGDAVSLVLFPLRDMTKQKGGLFVSVTLADGTVLKENAFAGNSGPVNVPTLPPATK